MDVKAVEYFYLLLLLRWLVKYTVELVKLFPEKRRATVQLQVSSGIIECKLASHTKLCVLQSFSFLSTLKVLRRNVLRHFLSYM